MLGDFAGLALLISYHLGYYLILRVLHRNYPMGIEHAVENIRG